MGYLVLLPLVTWFLLGWIWKLWEPDADSENRLERALAGLTGGVLLALAIIIALSDTHIDNTLSMRTHDGMQNVGDYITLPCPDWGVVVLLIIVAGFSF